MSMHPAAARAPAALPRCLPLSLSLLSLYFPFEPGASLFSLATALAVPQIPLSSLSLDLNVTHDTHTHRTHTVHIHTYTHTHTYFSSLSLAPPLSPVLERPSLAAPSFALIKGRTVHAAAARARCRRHLPGDMSVSDR